MTKKYLQIQGDIFGGITAGIVALPLALAFGVQSGLGAIAGLYGAIALGFFAALFGGTSTQISGPTGPMTVFSVLIISNAIQATGNVENAMGVVILTFFLAGLFEVIFGFARIGRYIKYIPYPVISGFMSGIGVIIIALQIFPFLGANSPKKIIDVITQLPAQLHQVNIYAVILALITIVIIYTLPKLTRAIPSVLVALLVGTLVSVFAHFPVVTIGNIPTGLPELQHGALFKFKWWEIQLMVIPALTLAALGAIDSLLTSIVADNLTKTKHNSNRELVGQGIGNMVTALVGGIPGAGATMRTVVNINAGGRTRLSGIIHSLLLLFILLGAGKYAAMIPLPVLAGILITVGIGIIDYKGWKHITHVPKTDAWIMLIVLVVTVLVDLLTAVAIGLILASILFIKKMGDIAEQETTLKPLEHISDEVTWPDEKGIPNQIVNKVYIKHLFGPLFFGFASQFQELVRKIPDVKYVIIRMKLVPYIDQTGLYAIEEAVLYLEQRGIDVILTGCRNQPLDMFRRIKLIPNLIKEELCFNEFDDSITWLLKKLT